MVMGDVLVTSEVYDEPPSRDAPQDLLRLPDMSGDPPGSPLKAALLLTNRFTRVVAHYVLAGTTLPAGRTV